MGSEPGGFRSSEYGLLESGDRLRTWRSRLGPGGSSLDPGIMTGAQRFFDRSGDRSWNLEEPGGSSLDLEILDWNPDAIWEHRGTVLHLPRQDYYRKSLTGLEDAGVGVMTQVPGFAAFHVWRTRGPRCALGCTGVLGSFDNTQVLLIGSFPFPGGTGWSLAPNPEYFLAGTQRPVSCLGSGGIQYLSFFTQQFARYCSISSSKSGNNRCTQVNRYCSFSEGFPQALHRSSNLAIAGSTQAGATL
ncbi:hypothetical protein F2Q69_00006014 [Brassica cretica]|uniref:Uncharacterized protein n=1 Tax=Brassica cretica TaxID=69181 RepID=A0A8S9P0Z5_BRACR|nr:hypothetical protein F2Q69_00006014 [Brassica cretica]